MAEWLWWCGWSIWVVSMCYLIYTITDHSHQRYEYAATLRSYGEKIDALNKQLAQTQDELLVARRTTASWMKHALKNGEKV